MIPGTKDEEYGDDESPFGTINIDNTARGIFYGLNFEIKQDITKSNKRILLHRNIFKS
jgi:hypothetical protein